MARTLALLHFDTPPLTFSPAAISNLYHLQKPHPVPEWLTLLI